MTYTVSLFHTGLVVGFALIFAHLAALLLPDLTGKLLQGFPRNRLAGKVLLVLAVVWCLWLVRTMDLGEFAALRNMMSIGVVVLGVLSWVFVDEFLSIRALAILALLAADVLLCAAFLQPQLSRLLLVFLAYAWIFAGLFWVGLPWMLRDSISWVLREPWRFRLASVAGVAYGALIVFCAFAYYR